MSVDLPDPPEPDGEPVTRYEMPPHVDADALQVMIAEDETRTLFLIVGHPVTGEPRAVGYHFGNADECRQIAIQLITPYDELTPESTMPPIWDL